jgi:hypothetical protein
VNRIFTLRCSLNQTRRCRHEISEYCELVTRDLLQCGFRFGKLQGRRDRRPSRGYRVLDRPHESTDERRDRHDKKR